MGEDFAGETLTRVKAVSASLIDCRPLESTFGQRIPWDLGRYLPHDPDCLRFSTVYVEAQVARIGIGLQPGQLR